MFDTLLDFGILLKDNASDFQHFDSLTLIEYCTFIDICLIDVHMYI